MLAIQFTTVSEGLRCKLISCSHRRFPSYISNGF